MIEQLKGTKTKTCAVCGGRFECGPAEPGGHCWCTELPNIMPFPGSGDCLCQDCLKLKIEEMQAKEVSADKKR